MKCDLHIHTCLSPCADITMVPGEVLKRAPDVVAICDHNIGGNVKSFRDVFQRCGKLVVPGIEVQTIEDVHILGYFFDILSLETFSLIVKKHLPKVNYDPERFGYQLYVNEKDEFTGVEETPLGFPTDLSLEKVISLILKFEGIPVYAHIGRKFGILYQLGVFPRLSVNICEVTNKEELDIARKNGFVAISSSDAHFLEQIGERYSIIDCEIKTVKSVLLSIVEGKVKTIWDF
ncbi:phosphotransferase [Thermosipho affectus]|uniref:Phosphotransferase n=1 Tax=Thermosipho affectus TaxID=660294 RepID=A0ABX3IH97_9BACT|nr:PHP-associated domain-containing protein [Thermosipho affectus]ONN27198.1 phosphotransferase [Thermosipho affectus]